MRTLGVSDLVLHGKAILPLVAPARQSRVAERTHVDVREAKYQGRKARRWHLKLTRDLPFLSSSSTKFILVLLQNREK
jgi:hypothetical protein